MKNAENKTKKEKRGLYISLALCLVAIALATWGTYDSLSSFIDNNDVIIDKDLDVNNGDKNVNTTPKPTEMPSPKPSASPTPEPTEQPTPTPTTEPTPQPSTNPTNTSLYEVRDNFIYPLANREVIGEYSGDELVYNEVMKDYRLHTGVDFKASEGESVNSCNNGIVTDVRKDLLLGNVVVIEHGDYEFCYCGLNDMILVKKGDIVKNASPIGTIDSVPYEANSTHLHLEVKKDGEYIDPLSLIFE